MEAAASKPRRRDGIAVFLAGTGAAFGAGNMGPVVPELAADFDLSLASVGLLAGTVYYLFVVIGLALAPRVGEKLGVVGGLRLTCLCGGAGSLIFAIAPDVIVLGAGRAFAGLALGFIGVFGPVYARETGGIPRVGVFGAAFQFGIGAGLATGSVLADLGADWRVGFVVSAVVALSALPLLGGVAAVSLSRPAGGFLKLARSTPRVYRLGMLFIAMFSVPLLLGTWLVHYLSVQGGMNVSLAGSLSFVLFGASALLRLVGANLDAKGVVPKVALRAGAPMLATVGVLLLALDTSFAVAAPAVILMAAGFAIPYAVMVVSAQALYPQEPADPVSLLTTLACLLPIGLIPLMGAALSDGYGEEAFGALAILITAAAVVNLKPANEPLGEPAQPGSG